MPRYLAVAVISIGILLIAKLIVLVPLTKRQVSSANNLGEVFRALATSFIKIKKSIGPRIDP